MAGANPSLRPDAAASGREHGRHCAFPMAGASDHLPLMAVNSWLAPGGEALHRRMTA